MMSEPAGLEEVINYADFKQEASLESVEDESTLEDEPDEQDLEDLIAGNITLNASRTIILPSGGYMNSLFFPYRSIAKQGFVTMIKRYARIVSLCCLPSTLWSLLQLVSFILRGSQSRCLTLRTPERPTQNPTVVQKKRGTRAPSPCYSFP